ncbi:hypothetical protein BSKO_11255 [Bryopsis sp. KO-2023]|nr:hypothetical protein BSKO_11255 [Bryopsis sp. KO-2023]
MSQFIAAARHEESRTAEILAGLKNDDRRQGFKERSNQMGEGENEDGEDDFRVYKCHAVGMGLDHCEQARWTLELEKQKHDLTEEVGRLRREVELTHEAARSSKVALCAAEAKASSLEMKLDVSTVESVRLLEDRAKYKRETERLEDIIRSIIRAIAQEIPIDKEIVNTLLKPDTHRQDCIASIGDVQEALHVYIEHCEHQVSFPLKSALFSVRSELVEANAKIESLKKHIKEELDGSQDNCKQVIESTVNDVFGRVHDNVEKLKNQVEGLKKQYNEEVDKVQSAYHEKVQERNDLDIARRASNLETASIAAESRAKPRWEFLRRNIIQPPPEDTPTAACSEDVGAVQPIQEDEADITLPSPPSMATKGGTGVVSDVSKLLDALNAMKAKNEP